MIDDPIKLTTTLASLLPINGGYLEEEFRLKDLKTGGSVRIGDNIQGLTKTLSILQQQSNENKSVGLVTDRTNVRIDLAYSGPNDGFGGAGPIVEAKGSVSIVFSIPCGIPNGIGYGNAQQCLAQLAILLLTESVDQTANTAVTVSGTRLSRILAGEP
jgi:hypothetical protein